MVTVRVDGDRQLKIYFRGLSANMKPALRRAVRASLLLLRRSIQEKLSGRVLRVGTGDLKGSVSTEMFPGNELGGRVGPNKVYAAIHEFGGIIRAKRAKYLHFRIHTSTRIRSKSGKKRLKTGVREYSWAKVKQVTIPARPYVEPSFKENVSRIEQIFANHIQGILN